ncbi:hypothetical protein D3C84_642170 [compost metagenome]
MFGQLNNLLQILLIADGVFFTLGDQGIQQRRHGLVILWVDRRLIDDQLAHVVLDGFCHSLLAAANALGQRLYRINAAFYDKLNQRHIIERRDFFALFSTDVGVDQKAHVRLIGLEVDVVATSNLHLVTYFVVVIYFVFDLGNLLGAVASLFKFIGHAGEAANQGRGHLVQV